MNVPIRNALLIDVAVCASGPSGIGSSCSRMFATSTWIQHRSDISRPSRVLATSYSRQSFSIPNARSRLGSLELTASGPTLPVRGSMTRIAYPAGVSTFLAALHPLSPVRPNASSQSICHFSRWSGMICGSAGTSAAGFAAALGAQRAA